MRPEKVYLLKPEIKKMVYDKFPVSKAEKTCKIEKNTMDNLRWREALRLFEEIGKENIQFK